MRKITAYFSAILVGLTLMPGMVFANHGTSSCSFSIKTFTGSTETMHSYLTIALNSGSPSGSMTTGTKELLRVDFTAKGSGCLTAQLDGFLFAIEATDKAKTRWLRDLRDGGVYGVDVDTGQRVTEDDFSWIKKNGSTGSGLVGFKMSGFTVEAGKTRRIAFYADVSKASASQDDTVRAYIGEDSLAWHDSYHKIFRMDHAAVNGSTLTF